jgi:serine/threonine protein kinase/Tfp pilus assembly protein PilF
MKTLPAGAPALGDRYAIERELGRGGMATVYLARDLRHSRPVAVKVLRPDPASAFGPARFLREIELAAGLTHPHILPLYDSGEADGLPYYIMPYVEGESLRSYLDREGRLPVDEAIRLAREIADALDYAHRHGIVHRDIKPENVLLQDSHAVVADFGVARAISAAVGENQTQAGAAVGTPVYMSPEQAGGEPGVDLRTDIYSLGCVLFEMLTGSPPLTAPSPLAILARRLMEKAPPLRSLDPSISPDLEAAVAKALAFDPAERFASAAEFAGVLAECARAGPAPARPRAAPRLPTGEASVAVLPFVNLSGDPENEYLSDGITEELINALVKVPGLRVAARTSSFAFKGKDQDVRAIGDRLRVRTLLEGSVRKAGNRVRVTAQLVNVADGYHLWSESYDRNLDDVFALQDELARTLVQTLRPQLMDGGQVSLVNWGTEQVPAYTLYLRARHFQLKRSAETYRQALKYFRQATEVDPGYARAYVGIAHSYIMLGFDQFAGMPPLEAMPPAKAAIAKALELDPMLPDAHARKAMITWLYDWQWEQARQEFAYAVSLDPQHTPTLHWHSMYLATVGCHDESLWTINRALRLEPESEYLQVQLGRCYYYARRYDEAVRQLLATVEMEPASVDNNVTLARVYLKLQRYEEAATLLEQVIARAGRVPILLGFLGQTYAASGRRADAEALLAELRTLAQSRYIPPTYLALVLMELGDTDAGFALWEQAYEMRSGWLPFLRVEPLWERIRSHPGYQGLLQRMGM